MNWRALSPWGAAIAVGCALLQPRFETITPEYGYVDGCTDVVLQGAKMGTDATVTIGGVELLQIEPAAVDPEVPEWAQDVGFKYFGVTPPAPGLEAGYYDVVMTIPQPDGKKGEPVIGSVVGGFYYQPCPASVHIDATSLAGPIAPGATIDLQGCGLDPEAVTVELVDGDGVPVTALPMTSTCSTAQTSLAVPPAIADGVYFLQLTHLDGTVVGGACAEWLDTGGVFPPDTDVGVDTDVDTDAETDVDTDADTDGGPPPDTVLDTAAPCSGTWAVVIRGGA